MKSAIALIAAAVLVASTPAVLAQRSPLPPTRVLNSIFTPEGVDYLEDFVSNSSPGLSVLTQPLYNELGADWWK